MSTTSAGLAVKWGYSNVKVMLKGVPGWKKVGRYVVSSQKFAKTGNIVLVDLRGTENFAAGHIPRAYNIPLSSFEEARDDFPGNMNAPIVLYGDGADQAYSMVKEWGYKKGSVLNGGLNGWLRAGNKLDGMPSPAEIVWARKIGKGEVSIGEFASAAANNPAGTVILDVRSDSEAAAGKYSKAIHIPLDEIPARMETLPKDSEILIHCSTGVRAEMAYQELKKAGYRARYVVGNFECDEDGCEISE